MPITVRTASNLKDILGGKAKTETDGATVRETFEQLGIIGEICEEDGKISRRFNIHINDGEDIRWLRGLDTPLKDGDVVTVISPIAGGKRREKIELPFRGSTP